MNHGRLVGDKEFDNTDEAERLMSYILAKIVPVPVRFDADRITILIDDVNYILLHGDLKDDARSAKQLAWDYGRSDKFNCILLGHYHSLIINKKDDGHNFRKVYCPSIVPTNDYAMSLGYQNNAGFTVISNSGDGLIDMNFHSLNYENL